MMQTIEELKDNYKNRDKIIGILSQNQHFRAAFIRNTNAAKIAQKNHKLTAVPSSFLARAMMGASMIANFLKGEERAIIELLGKGPISKVYAEASHNGESRGYVEFANNVEVKHSVSNSENVIGVGFLKVTRILYDHAEPVTGIIELSKSDVASDIAYYFNKSEQIPTAVLMEVDIDENGLIDSSSGLIIQAMPGSAYEELQMIFQKVDQMLSKGKLFDKTKSIEELLSEIVPFNYSITKKNLIDFFCRCTKDSFINALITLELKEIEEMQNHGQNELVCKYCNKHYYLDEQDFTKVIEIIKSRNN